MLSLSPVATCRKRMRDPKNGGGMWLQYGAPALEGKIKYRQKALPGLYHSGVEQPLAGAFPDRPPSPCCGATRAAKFAGVLPVHSASFALGMVDNKPGRSLYNPSWTRRRLARWRVREAPHCLYGDIRP
jgi:hypothetical protein